MSGALSQTWPSVQPPAGVERNGALYARPASKSKADGSLDLNLDLDFGGRLDDLGQPDGELGAFPDQISPRTSHILRFASSFQALEQNFHVLAEQPLPELGVNAGMGQFFLGYGYEFAHD